MSDPVLHGRRPSPGAVLGELERILASGVFANAPVLSRFLRHIVDCWLAGDANAPKEYVIGAEVFGRGAGFDPATDTIVRVHARRLRARLERYYAREGADDPILIALPKGHYRVQIAPRADAGANGPGVAERRPPGGCSVGVVPFANMSGDPEQEYLSDGITEDLITDLSKVSALRVASRNTSFAFKGRDDDTRAIARALEVTHVLCGSIRRDCGRIRISARLIDGASDRHVWAERYDRDARDIFALNDEISQAIVAALRLRLLPEERVAIGRRGTADPEAHDLYLMARGIYVANLEADVRALRAIVGLCSSIVDLDPHYAQAWALLAMGQRGLWELGLQAEDGMTAAERALALDAGLPEAYATKAAILQVKGALEAALQQVEIALDLDPDSYEANRTAASLAYQQHRFGDAIRYYERVTRLMEADLNSPMMLVSCHRAAGDGEALRRAAAMALQRADAALARDANNATVIAYGANALAALGDGARAKARARRALLVDPDNWNIRYNFACALNAYLDDRAGALEVLEPLFAQIAIPLLGYLKHDPDLESLRDEPRYRSMLAAAEARLAVAAPSIGDTQDRPGEASCAGTDNLDTDA